ncbi:MAG: tyrosine-type recombinase/integrase [Gammaproteobacteria bacterium]|nr:tyrosine-type recombinase/integrase [Gammaproteobacteria bacterium]
MPTITVTQARNLRLGGTLSESFGRGAGTFQLRCAGARVVGYYRYTDSERRQQRVSLGPFDAEGRAGRTLQQLRAAAQDLSRRYLSGDTNLRDILDTEQAEREAARRTAREAEDRARTCTLGALLQDYMEYQEGRADGRKTAAALEKHVIEKHTDLVEKLAADVTTHDIMEILAPLHSAGKLRQFNKLRSYLGAAYSRALRSRGDVGLRHLQPFGVAVNPVLPIAHAQEHAGQRYLNSEELREYTRILRDGQDWASRFLYFHLLVGGQRINQLLRLQRQDINDEAFTLWDAKGRRQEPRRHDLPLTDTARALLGTFLVVKTQAPTDYIFVRSDGGRFVPSTLWGFIGGISRRIGGEAFTAQDIRRTTETHLLRAGVSRDMRGQLLSHGMGGVQERHYVRGDFLAEKRAALIRWESYLQCLAR